MAHKQKERNKQRKHKQKLVSENCFEEAPVFDLLDKDFKAATKNVFAELKVNIAEDYLTKEYQESDIINKNQIKVWS